MVEDADASTMIGSSTDHTTLDAAPLNQLPPPPIISNEATLIHYLHHLLYSAKLLLLQSGPDEDWVDPNNHAMNDLDAWTDEWAWHHQQKLQEMTKHTSAQQSMEELAFLLIQICQLDTIGRKMTKQLHYFMFPQINQDDPYNVREWPLLPCDTNSDDDDDNDDDDDHPEQLHPRQSSDKTAYQYRRMDAVRRLLRSTAPIAIDLVALIVSVSSSVSTSASSMSARALLDQPVVVSDSTSQIFATYILLSIWLPIAPHIQPLVTQFLQIHPHHPLYAARSMWLSVRSSKQNMVIDSVVLQQQQQQINIILEVTWILCQFYRSQQNSITLRNDIDWTPIYVWLCYNDDENSNPTNSDTTSDVIMTDSNVDPNHPSSTNQVYISVDEWTCEREMIWYAIRIISFVQNYTPVYTAAMLQKYHVYYDDHYVPWRQHSWDIQDEELQYQNCHILGHTKIGSILKDIPLPDLTTVREHIALHPYLVHIGNGLVFVKHFLRHSTEGTTTDTSSTVTDAATMDMTSSSSSSSPQQGGLIRTSTTCHNLYKIGIAFCIPQKPILICGPHGSGKSSLIRELAYEFHNTIAMDRSSNHHHHRSIDRSLLEIHVDDETDTKTLVGSYTATDIPGEFEWRPGALTRAVESGQWVLLEDFDTIPMEIQASLEPLFKHRTLSLGNGTTIQCHPNFRLFGTISTEGSSNSNSSSTPSIVQGNVPAVTTMPKIIGRRRLLNSALWTMVYVDPLPLSELKEIGLQQYKHMPPSIIDATVSVFQALDQSDRRDDNDAVTVERNENSVYQNRNKLWIGRHPSVRDLFKALSRIANSIPFERDVIYTTESQRTLCLAEIVDVFAAACPATAIRKDFIRQIVAPILNITADLGIAYVECRRPTILMHDTFTELGRVRITVSSEQAMARSHSDQFAQTSYALRLMEAIGVCIRENEPTLLVGETGTGKTTMLQHLAQCCGRELVVQNLSLQTDSADLLGGYRPLEIQHVARNVYQTFVDLFTGTFSRKQNAEFLSFAAASLQKEQWMKLSQCFRRAAQLGLTKLKKEAVVLPTVAAWERFKSTAERFEKQRLACASGLAFVFTEGALVDAIRKGKWVLLDEINLASSETLQRLCGLLDDSSSSLTLTERGDAIAIERHPSFRLFAAMNPATDSGKKDLTPSIRARFTEFYVDELLDPVELRVVASRYISGVLPSNDRPPEHSETVIIVVDLYLQCRDLAERVLVDGNGQKPRYTLRTLSRALTAAKTIVVNQKLPLHRALFEGFQLAFQGPLDEKSLKVVDNLLLRALGNGFDRSHLDHPGKRPSGRGDEDRYILIKPFWIQKGPLDSVDWSLKNAKTGRSRFILVPSTMSNLRRLIRTIASGPWPLLLEGPTSAGKTSLVEYIAARCGHHVVRINNHEHTDVQEYTGGFVSDSSGSLTFVDGILVQALRLGHWVILDELNLAPSEVLEALNRLLDDNRELYIAEINEIVKPHPNFRLFATQNPSGTYGGRKPLSRAFRNRFVEIQINDIPSIEMITILEKRCGCPASHAKILVEVMDSLRQRRSRSGIFLGKDGLITPRDLLRWADRGASSKIELAQEGYMLLAERLRSSEEQDCVKEEIEKHLKVTVDVDSLYYGNESFARSLLARVHDVTRSDLYKENLSNIAETKSLLRLITLVYRCVKSSEPVLLVGGK
jgi:MoxR-like ATPase